MTRLIFEMRHTMLQTVKPLHFYPQEPFGATFECLSSSLLGMPAGTSPCLPRGRQSRRSVLLPLGLYRALSSPGRLITATSPPPPRKGGSRESTTP